MLSRRKLESQVGFARAESRRLEHDTKKLAAQHQSHTCATQQATHAFVPAEAVKASQAGVDGRVLLVVGGQRFECTRALLCRDGGSLLAALCAVGAPLAEGAGGEQQQQQQAAEGEEDEGRPTACFERDWWLFRYVLDFLRDGSLPAAPQLVWRLYEEASFWQLRSLQRAVEERHAGLFRRAAGTQGQQPGQLSAEERRKFVAAAQRSQGIVPASDGSIATDKSDKPALPTDSDWWTKAPAWWGEKPKPKPKLKVNPTWDWWTAQKAKGLDFTALSDWKGLPPPKDTKEKDLRKKLLAAEKETMLRTSYADVGRGLAGYGADGGGGFGFGDFY